MEIDLNCFCLSLLYTIRLYENKRKDWSIRPIRPKINMPTFQSDIAAAYDSKDFLMNRDMEREMLKEIQEFSKRMIT